MLWLDEIVRGIRSYRNLEAYAVILLGLVIAVLSLFKLPTNFGISVILIILSAMTYSLVRIMRLLDANSDIMGITSFHTSKQKGLHPFEKYGLSAQHDISISAIQCNSFINEYPEQMKMKAKNGCKIRLLMMAENTIDGQPNPSVEAIESIKPYTNLRSRLRNSRESLSSWLNSLPQTIQKQIEIRQSIDHPTVSFFIVDQKDINGVARIELILPRVQGSELPNYVVQKRNDETFFEMHCKSFQKSWDEAFPITGIE